MRTQSGWSFALALLLSISCAAAQPATHPTGGAAIQNDDFKFTATVPNGWQQTTNATVLDVIYTLAPNDPAALKGRAVVIITALHLPKRPVMGSPLRSFVRSVNNTLLGEEVGLLTMNETDVLVDGAPAVRFRTEHKKDERRRIGHHCAILRGGDGIEIGCTVDGEDEKLAAETLDRLLASIRWGTPAFADADLATFAPKGAPFSFRHPAKWIARPDAPRGYLAVIQSADLRTRSNQPAVTLAVYAPKPMAGAGAGDVEQLAKAVNDYVRAFVADNPGAKMVERADLTLDGAPAQMVTIEGKLTRLDVHMRSLVCVHGGQVCIVETMAPREFSLELRVAMQPLLDSWKWTK